VAARGLDIEDLGAVVNYDVPQRSGHLPASHRPHRPCGARRHGADLCTSRELSAPAGDRGRAGNCSHAAAPAAGALARERRVTRTDGDAAHRRGRTDKLRPGDIVGALTGEGGLKGDAIGKIDVFATRSYVAVAAQQAGQALSRLQDGKIKARKFRVRRL
jgi:ATP-independent RNA helicase DbpA